MIKTIHFAFAFVVVLSLSFVSSAAVGVWTGEGGDGSWMNEANWEGGFIPGVTASGGQPGDCALFGPVADGAITEVDVSELVSIGAVRFEGEGTAAYTIGTSEFPAIVFEPTLGDARVIFVDETVGTPQTFAANVQFGLNADSNHRALIEHNGGALLGFNSGVAGPVNAFVDIYGSGDTFFRSFYEGARFVSYSAGCTRFGLLGHELWLKNLTTYGAGERHFRIDADRVIRTIDGSNPSFCISARNNLLVDGDGVLSSGVFNGHPTGFMAEPGATLTLACSKVESDAAARPAPYLWLSGGGCIVLDTILSGFYQPHKVSDGTTVRVRKIGCKDSAEGADDSNLGSGDAGVAFVGPGTLEYVGLGETTDRSIIFEAGVVGNLKNNGTGALVYSGDVGNAVAGTMLALSGDSAPIVFSGHFICNEAAALRLGGAAGVCVASTNTAVRTLEIAPGFATLCEAACIPELESCIFDGGALVIDHADDTLALPALTVRSGDCRLLPPAGTSVTLESFSCIDGTLSIETADAVTMLDDSLHGGTVKGLLLNGCPVFISETGILEPLGWKQAVDGHWTDATKWTGPLPSDMTTATIAVKGLSPYTVSLDEPLLSPLYGLWIGTGDPTLSATLDISVNTSFGAGTLAVRQGGIMRLSAQATVDVTRTEMILAGGKVRAVDSACLVVTNHQSFGTGEMCFDDDSILYFKTEEGDALSITPKGEDETSILVMDGASAWKANHPNLRLSICSNRSGGVGRLELRSSKSMDNIYGMAVGHLNGRGELLVAERTQLPIGNYGLFVGSSHSGDPYNDTASGTCHPTGLVEVAGGTISISAWGTSYLPFPCGLVVGNGALTTGDNDASSYVGAFTMTAGSLSVAKGYFIVGCGSSNGDFLQSGGSLLFNGSFNSGSAEVSLPFVVGLSGGKGDFRQTGGIAEIKNADVFVGGAAMADLQRGNGIVGFSDRYPADRTDAEGRLSVSNGSFTVEEDLIVGACGRGRLELGEGGCVTTKNTVLSNATESVLSFTFGPRGTGMLVCSESLAIADAARLEIDLAHYKGPRRKHRLVFAASLSGVFDAAAVHIRNAHDYPGACVIQSEDGLFLRTGVSGFSLIVR